MKKIAILITFLLAFNINAQENEKKAKKDISLAAKNEANEIGGFLDLSENQIKEFNRLFYIKYLTLQEVLPEEKEVKNAKIVQIIDSKIRASLTSSQIEKYDANSEMKSRLLNVEL